MTPEQVKEWRSAFEQDMASIRASLEYLSGLKERALTVEDIVFLWELGIQVED